MRSGRARALLLTTLVTGGALALGAAWFLCDGARADGGGALRHAATTPEMEGEAKPANAAPTRTPGDADPKSAAGDDGANGDDDPNAEFRGSGTVALTVVDAATDLPIADLPFLCWSERPRVHVYARSVTDAKGQAELANLPEDLVIFETARRTPYANTTWATWLPKGRRREVTMRVTRGGTVRGRVVDDLGRPLEGVAVRFDARPAQQAMEGMKSVLEESPVIAERFKRRHELIAKSGADGRFEATALLSRYSAVWLKNDVLDPKNELPIAIQMQWRQVHVDRWVKVEDGRTCDLGDVVVARSRVFTGRVVERDGTRVGGALVSGRWLRYRALLSLPSRTPPSAEFASFLQHDQEPDFDPSRWPGTAGFALADEETQTTGDGGFELDVTESSQACVATSDGRVERFPWPAAQSGTRTDGVEWKLSRQTILALTLTENDGAALTNPKHDSVRVIAVLDSKGEVHTDEVASPPSRCEARFKELANDHVVGLLVELDGYERRRADWRPPPNGRDALALELTPVVRHALKLRFKLHDRKEMDHLKQQNLEVAACLFGPERRLSTAEGVPHHCGLDVDGWYSVHPVMDVDLEVGNARDWNVYVTGPFAADVADFTAIHVGAFRPDGSRHEVELPPLSPAWLAKQELLAREAKEKQDAAPPSPPRAQYAKVRFAAVDAVTGAALEKAQVVVKGDGGGSGWSSSFDYGSNGAIVSRLPAGRHVAKVTAPDHRDSAEIDYSGAADGTVDLGTVRLEPVARCTLRLVDRDGKTPAGSYSVGASFGEPARLSFGGDIVSGVNVGAGLFELRADRPERFTLTITPKVDGSAPVANTWSQRVEVERWGLDETRDVVVAR